MKRVRLLALTAAVLLAAGSATAAAQGDSQDKSAPGGMDDAAPLAAHNQYSGTAVTIPAGGTAWATVNCPAGEVPTGGGAGTSGYDIYLTDTRPTTTGWIVYGKNVGTYSQTLRAWVVCTVP